MKKSEPPELLPARRREVVYRTVSKGSPSKQTISSISESSGPVLGYKPGEFTSNRDLYLSLIHPDDAPTVEKGWRRIVESGKARVLVYRIRPKKSRNYIWVEDKVQARRNSKGKTIGVAGSLADVTERRRAEDALRADGERLRNIFDDAAIGMYRTTPDGKVLFANKLLVEMLGYESFEDLSDSNLNREVYPPGYPRNQFRKRIESDGRVKGLEAAWKRKDGTTFFGRETAQLVRDRNGRVMYYEGTVEDISDQKRAESRAARINQVLRTMSDVSQVIMRETKSDVLFGEVCKKIVMVGGYRMAWIGIPDGTGKTLTPLASGGPEEDELKAMLAASDDGTDERDLVGRVLESGEAYVCNDTASDRNSASLFSWILRNGYRSVGIFPMHVRETVLGALSIYSEMKDCFISEETHLLSRLADDIGFALWAVEARRQQEAADEVIRDREFWLKESQRVANLGSYVYEIKSGTWSASEVLYDIVGINSSYRRDFRSWLRLIHPEDRAALLSVIEKSIPAGKQFDVEFRIIRAKDKKVRRMWGSAEVLIGPTGKPVTLFGTVQDITERSRMQEELRNERILLKTLVDNLPNSIYVKDKNYRKVLANPQNYRQARALSEDEVLGKTDFELYPREIAEKFFEDDRKVIERGEAINDREEFISDQEGNTKWQLTSKIPLRDEKGEIVGLVGIGTDITERKIAEEEQRREHILLKTIIDLIPNAIFAKDKNFRKVLANPAHVERVSSHIGPQTAGGLLGKTDLDVYPRELAEEYLRDDRKTLRDGKSVRNKPMSYTDRDGQKHWELVSKIPMKDDRGKIIGLVGVSTDITALREAEEKLAESEAKFRLLAENARDIVYRYSFSPEPHFEYISPSATMISGYTPEEFYADPDLFFKIVNPYDRLSGRNPGPGSELKDNAIIARWKRKDGNAIWVEMQNHPVIAGDGSPLAVEGIIRDITERKKSEEALRVSEETMARITSSIRDAIYSIDGATGEFEYLSPAFRKMFGFSEEDIKEMGGRWAFLQTIIEGVDQFKPDPVLNEMKRERIDSPPVWEQWWKCKDGSRLFIEDYSIPIYDGAKLIRVDGVLRDITGRKRAEDQVEKERILLRTLIDNFPYAIYVKDRNYRKVIANPVDVQRFAGLTSEAQIVGKTDFDIYPQEVAEKLFADDRKVILEGRPVLGREELVIDAKGTEHWLLTTKVPLRDKSDEIIGLVGVGVDVTEKRAVDEALRQSEAELRALFESMNDVVMSIDADGRYIKVAPTDPSLLLVPADEMVGKTLFDVLPEEQAVLFLSVVRETLRTAKTQTLEYSLMIGGEDKWRAASVSPMTEKSVIWVARDITERKSMEKEITESEKKYRELVENALIGVYKINLSGKIVYANKAMADMLEFDSPLEMMSVSSSSLYRNIEEMNNFLQELRTSGKTGKNREVELVTKNGRARNVLLSASLDGEVISGMAKDITEMRALERQIMQTQKLEGLGNIAAGIAHDFNNILGVIIGYSDLIGQSPFDQVKFDRGIQAIAKSADRGKSLVRQLLTFARKTDVAFESLSLNNAVTDIEKLVTETFPRTVELHTDLKKGLPPVLADATQIHQVLLNLCVNARDAMPKGGKLLISTGVVPGSSLASAHPHAAGADYVELRVSDTGTGMDKATRQRIFEPFFTTKGVGKGTGLGLSVVYGIVESHRGFIDVTSEPEKGTTFRIYIPALERSLVKSEIGQEHGENIDGEGETILVIEDEEMLRELLRSILTSRGYRVLVATDGEDGVTAFLRNKDMIGLVITDLGLPKMSGEEVVGTIRKISGSARIAIASGFIDPEVKSRLEWENIVHFIQKPYKAEEVLRVVHEITAVDKI